MSEKGKRQNEGTAKAGRELGKFSGCVWVLAGLSCLKLGQNFLLSAYKFTLASCSSYRTTTHLLDIKRKKKEEDREGEKNKKEKEKWQQTHFKRYID